MPRSHRHPCLPLWAPLSTQPRPHRELHSVHSAAGRDVAPPPLIHAPAAGGASIHGQAAQTPPKHWALETPQSTHDGLPTPWHGRYGPVYSQEPGAVHACAVAYVVAAGQRQQVWGSSTDDADPAPSYHRW